MRYMIKTLVVLLCALNVSAAQQLDSQQVPDMGTEDGPRAALPPEQAEAGSRNIESLRQTGEVHMESDARRADEAYQLVVKPTAFASEFRQLDRNSIGRFSEDLANPATIDERYLTPSSRSYVSSIDSEIAQIHTRTRYGTLVVEEYPNTSSRGGAEPNTLIGGKPANIVHIRYKEGWATAVYVQHGSSFFTVENDRRVSDDEISDYLEMVEKLVLKSQDKRNARQLAEN